MKWWYSVEDDVKIKKARMRVTFGWFGEKVEFYSDVFGWVLWTLPILQKMSEDEMQKHIDMELINPPVWECGGEWKPVFDRDKNIVPKFYPPAEVAERLRLASKAKKDVYFFY